MTTGNNLSDFKALLDQKEHSVASDLKGLKTEIKQKVDTRK
jgi:hypothetical protein